jgi:hypothetical protein
MQKPAIERKKNTVAYCPCSTKGASTGIDPYQVNNIKSPINAQAKALCKERKIGPRALGLWR